MLLFPLKITLGSWRRNNIGVLNKLPPSFSPCWRSSGGGLFLCQWEDVTWCIPDLWFCAVWITLSGIESFHWPTSEGARKISESVFSGGALVHPVPSRGGSVQSGPEGAGAGGEAAGAAVGPQRDRLSEIPPPVQPQWVGFVFVAIAVMRVTTVWLIE